MIKKNIILFFLFHLIISGICQEFNHLNTQQLDSLKKIAIDNQDFELAQKIKEEQHNRNYNFEAKQLLVNDLKIAIEKEDFLLASEIKSKINLFDRLDSLENKKKELSKIKGLEVTNTINDEIIQLKKKLEIPLNKSELSISSPEKRIHKTDTLYYDTDWLGVNDFNSCTYIRIINLNEDSEIINPVVDYFDTWDKAGIGEAISINPRDDSKSVWGGTVEVFSLSGETIFKKDYSAPKRILYKAGKEIYYFASNNVIIALSLDIDLSYGKYYMVNISIMNFTGEEFDFDPKGISAVFKTENKFANAQILDDEEFMKRVKNRQSWDSALNAFAEISAASTAGYNTTSYNSNEISLSNSNSTANGFAYDNRGNFISANANSRTNTSTYTTKSGNILSYDGAANYYAQQNARNNISNFNNQQYQILRNINKDYLKKNTIFSSEQIVGYFNIVFEKQETLFLIIPVNGFYYTFDYNLNQQKKKVKEKLQNVVFD